MKTDISRTVAGINTRIGDREAIALTEFELCNKLQKGVRFGPVDVDVIIVSCRAPMSGTAVMLCVPVAGRGLFTRAREMRLNGLRCAPGPAPNERLGVVDTQLFADQLNEDGQYSGTAFIIDLLERKTIEVECLSMEGTVYRNRFTLDDLEFARMYVYNFSPDPGNNGRNASITQLQMPSGGSKILLNDAPCVLIGGGSRSRPGKLSFSMAADLFEMEVRRITRGPGGSLMNTIAVALPVLNDKSFKGIVSYCMTHDDVDASERAAREKACLCMKNMIREARLLLTCTETMVE